MSNSQYLEKYGALIKFIRTMYRTEAFIPLHEPVFFGNEKKYLEECIESSFVSSVGKFVDKFEEMVARFVGAKYAVATVNGTAALHIGLMIAGVEPDTEVITQPVTFIATANAISYCGAMPVFLDCDKETWGLSPKAVESFFKDHTVIRDGVCINKKTQKRVAACVPMHTFGYPCDIEAVCKICENYGVPVVEDAAESLGSYYKGVHTGTFGKVGVFSFNGNKIITAGGGGMIVTDDEALAKRAKHITTTAKVAHQWEFVHDEVGYNYRLTNINAALGCAQMESLPEILALKKKMSKRYEDFFKETGFKTMTQSDEVDANNWFNCIQLENRGERDLLLEITNTDKVMTRPVWTLMNKLEMYKDAQTDDLTNAGIIEDTVVNLPSSVIRGI